MVYDDDHYYMGGVIAELLHNKGHNVTLATPANCVSAWTEHTLEQHRIQARLISLGISIVSAHELANTSEQGVQLRCVYTGKSSDIDVQALVMISSRLPQASLYKELQAALVDDNQHVKTLRCVGDCLAPSTVAAAVYSGHLAARELGQDMNADLFTREMVRFN